MERHEILEAMSALKLTGMKAAYDDIVTTGINGGTASKRSWAHCCKRRSQPNKRVR